MELAELMASMGPATEAAEALVLLDHPETREEHLMALLRRRNLAAAVIEAIARHERWRHRHALRSAVASHPKTPRTLALRLIPSLYWQTLLRIATNVRIPMAVRVAAEKQLRERLSELELGERISLARAAPRGLIERLMQERDPRVIQALLLNPRLREAEVHRLADDRETPSEVLRVLAQSPQWSSRNAIRLALVQHARTPVHVALQLLSRLPRPVVSELVAKRVLPRLVHVTAERMLSGEPFPGGRFR